MLPRPLRFVTFLAPNMYPVYDFITRRVGEQLGLPTELTVGKSYDELRDQSPLSPGGRGAGGEGAALAEASPSPQPSPARGEGGNPPDISFVCGLAYVELAQRGEAAVEPIAAPLLRGPRYGSRPVYYSDVIVHRDCPARSFAELRGRSWAYNEPLSHSGYGVTRYHLVRLGETTGFFGKVVEAGWHERSVHLVCNGEVDAAAIDSQVLAVMLRDQPELAERLRIIDALGPSTIQPVVAARRLPQALKAELRDVLLELGDDPSARPHLDRGLIERFVPVGDADYDDVRAMQAACVAAGFLTLR